MKSFRWIRNFIGRLKGYSGCKKCKGTWNWKDGKVISYDKQTGMFALCTECFDKLTINEVIFWYEDVLNDHVRGSPIDYTSERIKIIRKNLRNSIIREKNKLRCENGKK